MNIKKLRKAHGLTQTELARKLNATQKVVTSYENKQASPTLEKLEMLADIFGITLDELVGREPVKISNFQRHVHGNSRIVKIQELYEKLPQLEQRAILKQIRALVKTSEQ